MQLQATDDVRAWLDGLEPGTPAHRFAYMALRFLHNLPQQPIDDVAPTLKRVRQARRHILWRVSHPYHPDVAVRLLAWFPGDGTVVVAVAGGDKAAIGDVWYDHHVPRAELAVDHWIRTHQQKDTP